MSDKIPSGQTEKIGILCVDDVFEIADQYSKLIDLEPDMQCVGTLDSADRLLEVVPELEPNVILLDLRMPGRNPLEALRELCDSGSTSRAILFSGFFDDELISKVFDAGGWGLVAKDADPDFVIGAIRQVAAGEMTFPK